MRNIWHRVLTTLVAFAVFGGLYAAQRVVMMEEAYWSG
jgi:hypothetical protein